MPGTVASLKNQLENLHAKYQLDIWLTEYSMADYNDPWTYPSAEVQADYAKQSAAMLDRLPFVKRYEWFSMSNFYPGGTAPLYNDDGTSTAVGQAYSEKR